jgi:hypothetical protein
VTGRLACAVLVAVAAGGLLVASEPEALYVGAGACFDCHPGAARVWIGSEHARTFVVLATGYPEMIDPAARGMVKEGYGGRIAAAASRLGRDTDCLRCHSTASSVAADRRAGTFHPEDGVQCEACHGPGSVHVARARGEIAVDDRAIARGSLEACARCHRPKASHEVLGRPELDAEAAWPRIAHTEAAD